MGFATAPMFTVVTAAPELAGPRVDLFVHGPNDRIYSTYSTGDPMPWHEWYEVGPTPG